MFQLMTGLAHVIFTKSVIVSTLFTILLCITYYHVVSGKEFWAESKDRDFACYGVLMVPVIGAIYAILAFENIGSNRPDYSKALIPLLIASFVPGIFKLALYGSLYIIIWYAISPTNVGTLIAFETISIIQVLMLLYTLSNFKNSAVKSSDVIVPMLILNFVAYLVLISILVLNINTFMPEAVSLNTYKYSGMVQEPTAKIIELRELTSELVYVYLVLKIGNSAVAIAKLNWYRVVNTEVLFFITLTQMLTLLPCIYALTSYTNFSIGLLNTGALFILSITLLPIVSVARGYTSICSLLVTTSPIMLAVLICTIA